MPNLSHFLDLCLTRAASLCSPRLLNSCFFSLLCFWVRLFRPQELSGSARRGGPLATRKPGPTPRPVGIYDAKRQDGGQTRDQHGRRHGRNRGSPSMTFTISSRLALSVLYTPVCASSALKRGYRSTPALLLDTQMKDEFAIVALFDTLAVACQPLNHGGDLVASQSEALIFSHLWLVFGPFVVTG